MNQKHLNIVARAAALSAFLQTEQDVNKSHALAAKLVGRELKHHLEKNAEQIADNLQTQYKKLKGDKKGKKKILAKWKKFIADHSDRHEEAFVIIPRKQTSAS